MDSGNEHREANRSLFMSSMKGLSTWLAAALTLIAAPSLYALTKTWAAHLAIQLYGWSWADPLQTVWYLLCWPICFFAIRASLVTAIMMAALTAAVRFV